MKVLKCLFFLILMTYSSTMLSQNYTERRWLIVITEDKNSIYQEQLNSILAEKDSAIERKIAVMHWTSSEVKSVFNYPQKQDNPLAYLKNRISDDKDFEVILVGLDGSIKLRQNTPISNDKLFELIDSMPMRQQEMRRKNKK